MFAKTMSLLTALAFTFAVDGCFCIKKTFVSLMKCFYNVLPFGTPLLFSPCITYLGCKTMYGYEADNASWPHPPLEMKFTSLQLKVPLPRNILSNNKKLYIYLCTKYVLKILTYRNYKKVSKRKILMYKYARTFLFFFFLIIGTYHIKTYSRYRGLRFQHVHK